MKVIYRFPLTFVFCLFAALIFQSSTASAQGTAFTYQGRLNANGGSANGTYDFQFQLAADPSGINHVGSPYSTNGVVVTNGLFATAMDFGPGILNGSNYWLVVYVRTNNGGVYTSLTPPQPLTPAPYAVFANSSSNLLGVLPAGQLSGTVPNGNLPVSPAFSTVTATSFAGSGVNVSNVNALALNGLVSSNFWQLGGNTVGSGQFLGSTNNQPVEVWVNGARVLRLEPGATGDGAPNVIGGSAINFVAPGVAAATIGGGGATNYFGVSYTNYVTSDLATVSGGVGNAATNTEATVGGGAINAAGGNAATVGGGQFNNATGGEATVGGGNVNTSSGDTSVVAGGGFNNAIGNRSTVGGGVGNSATNYYSTVAGGGNNLAGGQYSIVAGGFENTNHGDYSAVGGGLLNVANGAFSTVPGGMGDLASGTYSFAAGQQAQATNAGAFVWADSQSSQFTSTNNDSFNVRAQGGVHFSTSGGGITVDGFPALASGGGSGITIQNNSDGAPNVIEGSSINFVASGVVGATVGGGGATNYSGAAYTNSVVGNFGTVSGGLQNTAAFADAVGGGYANTALATYSTVAGGVYNTNDSDYAVIGGGIQNYVHLAGVSTIGGGNQNQIVATGFGDFFDTIGGGGNNFETNTVYSFIGGGVSNLDFTSYSVIGGGAMNALNIYARYSVIGGGQGNAVGTNSDHSVIAGGLYNFIGTNSSGSTVSGGVSNLISNGTFFGTIGGGTNNFVNGIDGTVAGGEENSASAFRDVVGGGLQNTASGGISTVAGGWTNVASGNAAFIGGGSHNVATALGAVVAGGVLNQATNGYATVPGGAENVAGGLYSFAAGLQAQALHQGSFVWSDSSGGAFSSVTNDEFAVRANGGVRIVADKGIHLNAADRPIIVRDWDVFTTNAPSYKAGIGRWGLFMEPSMLTIGIPSNDVSPRFFQVAKYSTNGNFTTLVLVDQAGDLFATNNVFAKGVQLTSDRNAKEHFTSLNPESVLAKVAAMPVTQWNYKSDSADDRHIGPVAQDFHKAFGLNGDDDKHISAVDESGVALAAIQGLNQEVGGLKTENTELKQQLAEMKQQLATLEKLVQERSSATR